jgi:hypothetical protein
MSTPFPTFFGEPKVHMEYFQSMTVKFAITHNIKLGKKMKKNYIIFLSLRRLTLVTTWKNVVEQG